MAGAYEIVKILDKDGSEIDQRVWNEDAGNSLGARQIVTHLAKTDGITIDPATSTKQPALGTAGTPAADVLTVQGAASMIALKVDGSAVTQPVSAVSLPLPTGAATSAKQDSLLAALLSSTSLSDANRTPIDERDGLAVSGSATSAATLFTQDMLGYESITVQVISAGSGCNISYETSDDNTNWVLTSGLISTSTGASSAQTLTFAAQMTQFPRRGRYFRARVSTYGSGTVSVVGTLSKFPANVVGVVNGLVSGLAGHGGAVSGGPVRIGVRAINANYSAVSTGQTADLVSTLVGALVQKPYSIPEADWSYAAAASGIVNTTTAVTVAIAAGAGLRNYITALQIDAEALTNATEVAIRDGAGGAVLWRMKIGTAGLLGGRNIAFPTPLKGTANTLLEVVTLTASGAGAVYFNAQGYIAP